MEQTEVAQANTPETVKPPETQPTTQGKNGESGDASAQNATTKTFTQAEVDQIIKDRLDRQRAKLDNDAAKARAEAEKAQAEQQGEFKKLYEAEQKAREALEAKVRAAELAELKRRAGAKYALPEAIALRLQGEDEAAIFADAEVVAKALPKTVAGNDAKNGTGAPNGAKAYGDLPSLQAVAERYNIKLPQSK